MPCQPGAGRSRGGGSGGRLTALVDGIGCWAWTGGRTLRRPSRPVPGSGTACWSRRQAISARTADVAMIPVAGRTIAAFNRAGLPVVVVTNQSGVARGLFGWDGFEAVQAEIDARLASQGAHVDAVFACGYHAEGSGALAVADHLWRKPAPGMIAEAAVRLGPGPGGIVHRRRQGRRPGGRAGGGTGGRPACRHRPRRGRRTDGSLWRCAPHGSRLCWANTSAPPWRCCPAWREGELMLIDDIAGRRVLVVGDVMLDVFVYGTVERVSPEAPGPGGQHRGGARHAGRRRQRGREHRGSRRPRRAGGRGGRGPGRRPASRNCSQRATA